MFRIFFNFLNDEINMRTLCLLFFLVFVSCTHSITSNEIFNKVDATIIGDTLNMNHIKQKGEVVYAGVQDNTTKGYEIIISTLNFNDSQFHYKPKKPFSYLLPQP